MRKLHIFLNISIFLLITLPVLPLWAGVELDGSMGTIGQIDLQDGIYDIRSDYGQQAGNNLFHSFRSFDINTNNTAQFSAFEHIENIISRITGGEQSFIDGMIKSVISETSTISNANLYLINPSGVVFGPNASLDIGGSFHVTTADYLRMGENERFYVSLENDVLSTKAPAAFGFLSSPAKIGFESAGEVEDGSGRTGLAVSTGKTISVIGGDIEMVGSFYNGTDTPAGNLYAPGGRIDIVSTASPGEVVPSDAVSKLGNDVSSFKTLGSISLLDHSLIDVSGEKSGNFFIRCEKFFVSNESVIQADTIGDKTGGFTDIQADSVQIDTSDIFSDTKGTGKGGDIMISGINAGPATSVDISASSKVFANSTTTAANGGNAGDIIINTQNLTLSESSEISTSSMGKGHGGLLTVNALKSVNINSSSQIFASSEGIESDSGRSGTIVIKTPEILLSNDSIISIDTDGGQGGNLTISGTGENFVESFNVSDSRIYAGALGTGEAGDVLIEAKNVSFTNKGNIGSQSKSSGRGGNVEINAEVVLLDSGAYISAESESESNGGTAGSIAIKAADFIKLNDSSITTEAVDAGGGMITLIAEKMLYSFKSRVATSVAKGGDNAGNINIDPQFVILNDSDIVANAYEGKGGNINIVADHFIQSGDSLVNASSKLGVDGTINILSPDVDISSGLVVLPSNLLDAGKWAKTPCAQRLGENTSRFVFTAEDAIPIAYDDLMPGIPVFFAPGEL
ncbi:filamentous hemagglutinin N-terminal domain-containing protein [Desulfobacterales bacterium HSG16]|nr:filamentous hemagglutinin N-terminal domain-containing protein [Desulfobacterales bacterium HSG16]